MTLRMKIVDTFQKLDSYARTKRVQLVNALIPPDFPIVQKPGVELGLVKKARGDLTANELTILLEDATCRALHGMLNFKCGKAQKEILTLTHPALCYLQVRSSWVRCLVGRRVK